jgi:glycosyltransferase 2 family protein
MSFAHRLRGLRQLWIAVLILGAGFGLWLAASGQADAWPDVKLVTPAALGAIVLAHVLFWLVACIFWRSALHASAGKRFGLREAFHQLAIVSVGKYIPGKVWGFLARAKALSEKDVSVSGALRVTALEQACMLLSGLIVAAVGAAISLAEISGGLAVTLGAVLLGASPWLVNPLLRVIDFLIVRLRPLNAASEIQAPRDSTRSSDVICLVALHILMWLLLAVVMCCIGIALGLMPFSWQVFAAVALASTAGIILGFAALFAPGGIGVREAVASGLLVSIMPLEHAIAVNLVFRVWTTLVDGLLLAYLGLAAVLNVQRPRLN